MGTALKLILGLNLAALAVLAFVYPHLMISPGKLIEGHRELTENCFACHAPLLGASSARCTACHKVTDIGIRTTKAVPIVGKETKVAFHQRLTEKACVDCHIDHIGVGVRHAKQRFSHQLLDMETRRQCTGCHQKPTDDLHRGLTQTCAQCHGTEAWKPATFNHAKHFLLDRDHDVKCTICHTTPDYKKYTCYGCHEHSPGKIRKEHLEEGIRDFENCVACHRSADEDEAKRAWRSLRRGEPYQFSPSFRERRERKKDDDDD